MSDRHNNKKKEELDRACVERDGLLREESKGWGR